MQELESGRDSLAFLKKRMEKMDLSKVLLFHGKNSWNASPLLDLIESIKNDGAWVEEFTDIPRNPSITGIKNAREIFERFKPTVIIACGGGSIIDLAKSVIAANASRGYDNLLQNRFLVSSKPYFIAIPTTAGSGSEATHFAVLYHNNRKYSIAAQELLPDLVIHNPLFVKNCPLEVSLASGADAICQSVESMWSRDGTPKSRALAAKALKLLYPTILKVIDVPGNLELWAEMQQGAWLAGTAINISKTTAGHALSYGLTIELGLPHGLAVLAIMRSLVAHMDREYRFFNTGDSWSIDHPLPLYTRDRDFPTYFIEIADRIWSRIRDLKPNALSSRIRTDRLSGARRASLVTALVGSVNVQRLSNHPVELNRCDIDGIYVETLEFLGTVF